MYEAGIDAVMVDVFTALVSASGDPAHNTCTVFVSKSVALIVSVKPGSPATALAGLISVIDAASGAERAPSCGTIKQTMTRVSDMRAIIPNRMQPLSIPRGVMFPPFA